MRENLNEARQFGEGGLRCPTAAHDWEPKDAKSHCASTAQAQPAQPWGPWRPSDATLRDWVAPAYGGGGARAETGLDLFGAQALGAGT